MEEKMYHKQVNKTAIQSQNMIADALFSLMKRKSFQQITVTEICDEAAIGRKTFYRNFDMKEDVVEFRLDILCDQYKEEITDMPLTDQLRHHMEFVRDHADVFITLYKNGIHQMVRDKFAILQPITMPKWTDDPVEQEYRSRYIVAGVEAVEQVWAERGFTESIDEVVAIIQRAHERQVPIIGKPADG
jgi:AcrR family transcriptional regulator